MFTLAHVHLILNHVPIMGSLFTTALFIIALIYRNTFIQKISLWFLVIIALVTAVTYQTGDPAAHAVRNLPQVSDSALKAHELFGKLGLGAMFVTGVVALGGVFFFRKRATIPGAYLALVMVILLVNCGLFTYISFLGGQILHPEIRALVPLLPLLHG